MKLCVDSNGRIKLHAKQKCEIPSATLLCAKNSLETTQRNININIQCIQFPNLLT